MDETEFRERILEIQERFKSTEDFHTYMTESRKYPIV